MQIKTLRWSIVVIVLILVIASITLDFYLPSILSSDALKDFKTSEIKRLAEIILKFSYSACIAAVITVFISGVVEKTENSLFLSRLDSKISEMQSDAIKSAYGQTVEPEIWSLLEEELFHTETIRKNMRVAINFTVNDDDTISEEMTWQEEIHNRTTEDILHEMIISTVDREGRVVLDKTEYHYLSDKNATEHLVSKNPQAIFNRHKIELPIKKDDILSISHSYILNFGFKDNYYQNTIGVKEFVIGLNITIHKPKGYLFTIELFSKRNKLIALKSFDNIQDGNQNETSLNYSYHKCLFPGTGIEYSLEKV